MTGATRSRGRQSRTTVQPTRHCGRTGHNHQGVCVTRALHPVCPVRPKALRKESEHLSKDDLIDMHGVVVAIHSGGLYRVKCDVGYEMLAQLSGRMRRFRIKVVPGDRVTVGVSPYDPFRGFITFRTR